MVWSRNDSWMVTADQTGYVKYWQSNMNNVKMFQAHKEPVRAIRCDILLITFASSQALYIVYIQFTLLEHININYCFLDVINCDALKFTSIDDDFISIDLGYLLLQLIIPIKFIFLTDGTTSNVNTSFFGFLPNDNFVNLVANLDSITVINLVPSNEIDIWSIRIAFIRNDTLVTTSATQWLT